MSKSPNTLSEITFPITPTFELERPPHTIDGVIKLVLNASAHSDRSRLGSVKEELVGANTANVYHMITDNGLGRAESDPSTADRLLQSFRYGITPEVTWDLRSEHQERTERKMRETHLKRVTEAVAEPDIAAAVEAGRRLQSISSYLDMRTDPYMRSAPSSDFLFRSFRSPEEVAEYWQFSLYGDERRLGVIEVAALYGRLNRDFNSAIDDAFSPKTPDEAMSWRQHMKAFLYLRTTRREDVTVEGLVTDLVEVMNSRDLGEYRKALTDLATEQPNMFTEHNLSLLGLSRKQLEEEKRNQQVQEKENERLEHERRIQQRYEDEQNAARVIHTVEATKDVSRNLGLHVLKVIQEYKEDPQYRLLLPGVAFTYVGNSGSLNYRLPAMVLNRTQDDELIVSEVQPKIDPFSENEFKKLPTTNITVRKIISGLVSGDVEDLGPANPEIVQKTLKVIRENPSWKYYNAAVKFYDAQMQGDEPEFTVFRWGNRI